jgi:hypothetical protein
MNNETTKTGLEATVVARLKPLVRRFLQVGIKLKIFSRYLFFIILVVKKLSVCQPLSFWARFLTPTLFSASSV